MSQALLVRRELVFPLQLALLARRALSGEVGLEARQPPAQCWGLVRFGTSVREADLQLRYLLPQLVLLGLDFFCQSVLVA